MCTNEEQYCPTLEECRKDQIAHGVFEDMTPFFAQFICAIARPTGEDEGEFIGSGSFMRLAGKTYLVTAAHVADEAETGSAVFSKGNDKTYRTVTTPFSVEPHLDFAVAPVTFEPPLASTRHACPSSHIALNTGTLEDILFIQGFPSKCSQYLEILQGIHSGTLPFGAALTKAWWPEFDPGGIRGVSPQKSNLEAGTDDVVGFHGAVIASSFSRGDLSCR